MNVAQGPYASVWSCFRRWATWIQAALGRAPTLFMLQVPAPIIAPEDQSNVDMLEDVEKALLDGSLGGRISASIQERYMGETAKARHDLIIRMSIFGTALFDAFLYVDVWVIPDMFWISVVLKLGVVTPWVAVLIAIPTRVKMPNGLRLALMSSALAIMLGTTLFLVSASHEPQAGLLAVAVSLVLVAGNVVLAFPFPWALAITIFGNLTIGLAIVLDSRLESAVRHFVPLFNVGASVLSLVGNYRIEAGARIAYLFALRETLRAAQLANANLRLRDLVDVDGLTGIGNRRYFDNQLASLWRLSSAGRPLALLMIDIDHFKALNDTFGHLAGDECIRVVARTLGCIVRPDVDTLARYGGEEFAVLIEGVTLEEARDLALRVRSAVSTLQIPFDPEARPLCVTVSIGCGVVEPEPGESALDFVAAIDAALYRAKQNGRNRVEIAVLDRPRRRSPPIARVA